MKRILAFLLCILMFGTMLSGCRTSPQKMLVGEWKAEADLAMAYEDSSVGILEGKAAARILCDGTATEVEKAAKEYDALQNSIEAAAERGSIDQIIAACDVRKYLIGAVEVLYSKREALPSRKHAAI